MLIVEPLLPRRWAEPCSATVPTVSTVASPVDLKLTQPCTEMALNFTNLGTVRNLGGEFAGLSKPALSDAQETRPLSPHGRFHDRLHDSWG